MIWLDWQSVSEKMPKKLAHKPRGKWMSLKHLSFKQKKSRSKD